LCRLTDLDVRKLEAFVENGSRGFPLFLISLPNDRGWWVWLPRKAGPHVEVLATAGW